MINYNILLADDDDDDRKLFKDALDELSVDVTLNTVNNGAELMHLLENNSVNLPHILFLDLNMPRKTGFECLREIKQDKKLNRLPVVIYSTSFDQEMIDLLYFNGAHYYIRKPVNFESIKKVIDKVLSLSAKNNLAKPPKERFVIHP